MKAGWYECQECEKKFYRETQTGPAPRYCSFKCRRASYERRIKVEAKAKTRRKRLERDQARRRKCELCGKEFILKSDNWGQRFCGKSCAAKWQFRKLKIAENTSFREFLDALRRK